MDNKKIALVLKTEGLEYDDRVRKEIVTIKKLYPEISFEIFAMLPENKEFEGVTEYGVPFRTIYIPARDKYGPAQKTALKSYQFYKVLKKKLIEYDAVWAADNSATVFPLLVHNKRILWDLHELPTNFMNKWWGKILLKYIFKRCRIVLHANPERIAYLDSLGIIQDSKKHIAIRNYPNFEDIDTEYDNKYNDFVSWKGDRRCVYLQGLANDSRASVESIEAVLRFNDLCAVVVGGFDKKAEIVLKERFGTNLFDKVFFIGKVAQLKIPQYIKQCFLTLVFYKNVRANNWYCEANRFYQSIIMGLPVVVGNNPTMKELVEKYGFGIVIDNDGSNVEKIVNGIDHVMANYNIYQENVIKNRSNLLWESQESIFITIIEKLYE